MTPECRQTLVAVVVDALDASAIKLPPQRIRRFIGELADRLDSHEPDPEADH